MKKGWIIFIVLLITVAVVIYVKINEVINRIDINVAYSKTNLSVINVQDLLRGKAHFQIQFIISIANKNWFSIPIKGLKTTIYYKGKLIGGSAKVQNIELPKNGSVEFQENINLLIKGDIISSLAADLAADVDPELEYETTLRVLGIRYAFKEKVKLIENISK